MESDSEEFDIPPWQMNEVRERMEEYKKNPDLALDFDKTMDEIEEEKLWTNSIMANPSFDFLNEPAEDVYSPKDGEPLND